MDMSISVVIGVIAVIFAIIIAAALMQEFKQKTTESGSVLTEAGNPDDIKGRISGAPFHEIWHAAKEIASARESSA